MNNIKIMFTCIKYLAGVGTVALTWFQITSFIFQHLPESLILHLLPSLKTSNLQISIRTNPAPPALKTEKDQTVIGAPRLAIY